MTSFEQHIISVGYVPHWFNGDKWEPVEYKPYSSSAPGRLQYRFIHPKRKRVIRFGISRHGKGPMLINPLPRSAFSDLHANEIMHQTEPAAFLRKLVR